MVSITFMVDFYYIYGWYYIYGFYYIYGWYSCNPCQPFNQGQTANLFQEL